VQEVALARHQPLVICGHESVSWSDLVWIMEANDRVTEPATAPHPHADAVISKAYLEDHSLVILETIRRKLERGEHLSLETLLRWTTRFEATDSRDKVYALLGMARNVDRNA
jgi:hypothetical protein